MIISGLKQVSTPKPNRRVLENNWVDAEKDLPSPILKGGSQEIESMNHALKTSSPLLSPVGSSAQSLGSGELGSNEDFIDVIFAKLCLVSSSRSSYQQRTCGHNVQKPK